MKRKTIYNLIMVAVIVAIIGGGILGVGYIRGWFDGEDGPMLQERFGVIRIERNGVNFVVEQDTALRTGDIITTQTGATAVVSVGNSTVALGGDARLIVTDVESERFYLAAGELFINAENEIVVSFDADNTQMAAGARIFLTATAQETDTTEINVAIRNATAAISYRSGAQTVSVFRGRVDDISAGQAKEYVGGGTYIGQIQIESLNAFQLTQIRKTNKDVSLCISDEELDALEEQRRQQIEDLINGATEPDDPVHEHRYEITVVAATCTSNGYTRYECACGESYQDSETPMADHSYGPWETVKTATESENGLMERACQNCEAKEEKIIEKLVHVHHYAEEAVAPTCTVDGYTQYTCACGDSYTDNVIPATGHTYRETVVAPDCTTQGYTVYTCACGDSYTDNVIPAIGHSWGEWETVAEATEDAEGRMKRVCSVCEVEEEKIIEKPSHVHSYSVEVVAASCTTTGYTLHTCACGDSYRDNETPIKDHSYGAWECIVEATETSEGLMRRNCQNCDATEDRVIGKLDHVHVYEDEVVLPTCTTKGYTQHTCACGYSYADNEVEPVAHTYEATVIAPTCTVQGYTVYTCTCGDSYTDNAVSATGHSWGEWETVTQATEDAEGRMKRVCSVCKAEEEKFIEKLSHVHSYSVEVVAASCTTTGYTLHTCACGDSYRDNETPVKDHSYGAWVTVKAATEQEDGLMERKCQNCEATEEKIIERSEHTHSYTDEVVAPTCTVDGYTLHLCACGHSYTDSVVSATGHSYGKEVIAPTCTVQGYTVYTCACGDTYTDDAVSATGHSWGDWVVTKEATTTENGEKYHICSACQEKETATIPMLDDGLYAYITIVCDTILDNLDELNPAKAEFVPSDGEILPMVKVSFEKGETVFDVLTRVCDQMGIQIEYSWTPKYGSYYIEGINNLYEFDCSSESGWMYKVNEWFPNYGCSSYYLKDGDIIVWCYTCHGWGKDVGDYWMGEEG